MFIVERSKIELSDIQKKMVISGWGEHTYNNTIVEKITYLSDGLKVKGYIAYPSDTSKKYPCVIWCRGGIGDKGKIDQFNARGIFGQLASWGFVVFFTQYRGNDGGEGYDEFGGADVRDITNLKNIAGELPFANTSNWAIEGWSRGGMMTYLTLTHDHDFKCAVVTGAIANLRCYEEETPFMKRLFEHGFGKTGSEDYCEKAKVRSVVNFPEKLPDDVPLLIVHGNKDDRVSPLDSLEISQKLLELKKPFRLLMLENGDHFLKKYRKIVDEQRKLWYQKYILKGTDDGKLLGM